MKNFKYELESKRASIGLSLAIFHGSVTVTKQYIAVAILKPTKNKTQPWWGRYKLQQSSVKLETQQQ